MAGNVMTVGNVSITSLSDGLLEFDLCNFFPSIPEENWQPYRDHLSPEGKVSFNLAAFLIRSDGKNILVDTGLGPKPADAPETPWGELLNDFQAHGISPGEIDAVVMTHLHRDHVGWNLQSSDGKYVPTFPNARYWLRPGRLGGLPRSGAGRGTVPQRSPVRVAAGGTRPDRVHGGERPR